MSDSFSPISPDARPAGFAGSLWGRLGLETKLIVGFTLLVAFSMSIGCWAYTAESRRLIARHAGEQAMQLARALAMASESPVARRDVAELDRTAADVLRTLDLAAVAYFSPEGSPLSLASRDPQINRSQTGFLQLPAAPTQELMRPIAVSTRTLGNLIKVTAPVLVGAQNSETGRTLGGFVTVCFSDNHAQAQAAKIRLLQLLLGVLTLTIVVPLVYALVRGVFHPIRELVSATHRIAAGDLNTRVAIDRLDVIGTLARSFNDMAKKVKSHQNHLEDMVQRRTNELEEANRRLSAEIAEKEDLVRAVSHDLNAPLRNISGMAQSLLARHCQGLDEEVIRRLERIRKNADIERGLIHELLEQSRIKSEHEHLEPVDVDALVRDLAGVFENDLKSRAIDFDVPGTLPVVLGDPWRLRQLFQNLIDNAIKYMGTGDSRQIRVSAIVCPTEAIFSIADTGIGIHPDDVDKVFHIFRRGRNAYAQNVCGKGVGLANVKGIVETFHGRIWVDSIHGQGSTFRFSLAGQFVPACAATGTPNAKLKAGLAC